MLAAFLAATPEFARSLADRPPDALVPQFLVSSCPRACWGWIAGILAAALSSIDSALNSLSAVVEEFLPSGAAGRLDLGAAGDGGVGRAGDWGRVGLLEIGGDLIELVNRVGSALYGPVLAVFLLAWRSRRADGWSAVAGAVAGLLANLALAAWAPVSWLWWNVVGCGGWPCGGSACWAEVWVAGRKNHDGEGRGHARAAGLLLLRDSPLCWRPSQWGALDVRPIFSRRQLGCWLSCLRGRPGLFRKSVIYRLILEPVTTRAVRLRHGSGSSAMDATEVEVGACPPGRAAPRAASGVDRVGCPTKRSRHPSRFPSAPVRAMSPMATALSTVIIDRWGDVLMASRAVPGRGRVDLAVADDVDGARAPSRSGSRPSSAMAVADIDHGPPQEELGDDAAVDVHLVVVDGHRPPPGM